MTNLLVIKSVRQDGALSSSHWQLKGVGEVVVTLTLVGEVGELVGVEEGHAVADEQLYKQSRNNQENYKERKVMSKITWKQRSSSDGEQSERSPSWSHWVQYGSSHWANFRQMWRGAGSWHEPCWDAGRIWQGLQRRYHQTWGTDWGCGQTRGFWRHAHSRSAPDIIIFSSSTKIFHKESWTFFKYN